MQRQDIAVGGVLVVDDKVLVIRRSQLETSSRGYWEFPKGRVEFGEDPKEALKREFIEEVNLKVDIGQVHHIYSHTYNSATHPGTRVHLIEIEYYVSLADGESLDNIKLNDQEHDSWRMVDKTEAEKLDKIYDDKKASLLSLFSSL